ncbi:MAG: purine-nucleoside phosphorylase [Planctomycetota bacterium]|nr:purine-nucleoside phosphorylase [Planctomycetota bacterium]
MAGGGVFEKVEEAARVAKRIVKRKPKAAIILGTGLGGLAAKIRVEGELDYGEIPHFPRPTVVSHAGRMVFGKLAGRDVLTFEGRFHCYEGHQVYDIVLPVRVAKRLGAGTLFLSGACGGMNPLYEKGDIVFLVDHINLMGVNPLVGPNDDRIGPRFPDMSAPYDMELVRAAEASAMKRGIRCHRGVYVAVMGPNLETGAEYRFLRTIGADVVGMSTVPEVLAAVHAGMRVFAASVVTDLCFPDALEPADINEIIAVANAAEPKLAAIVCDVLKKL